MRRHFTVVLVGLFAVALAAPVMAQDNVSGLGSYEGAQGTIFKSLTSNNNYFAALYRCTDPTATSTVLSAAVADCCVSGDIYRASVAKGFKGARFAHTANVSQTTAGAAAFAPDVFSPNANSGGAVKSVAVTATAGNSHPGGLPAGWTLRVATNGGGPVCDRRAVVNGTAAP